MAQKFRQYPKSIASKEEYETIINNYESQVSLDGGLYCARLCNLFAPGYARFEETEQECVSSLCSPRPVR